MDKQRFSELLAGYTTKTLPPEAVQQLRELLTDRHYQNMLEEIIDEQMEAEFMDSVNLQALYPAIQAGIDAQIARVTNPVVHRVRFLRRRWLRYAAAITIGLGIAAYLWTTNRKPDQNLSNSSNQLQTDVPPGGDKAVLTLADGSKIVLDKAANGNLAQQGNAAIVKLTNGQIAYDLKGLTGTDVMMNTLATPKGGQYQLTLPDGSKVWLNAASSIQFPVAFAGATRNVKITGEAYLEVATNKEKPFIVDVDGKANIQVLGTSFNVNSYEDEGSIKATLVEGSVRISNSNKQAVLKPGNQAIATSTRSHSGTGSDRQLEIVNADIEQTLAWKNGIFNFNGLGVRAVMAQLARWYDIDVRYEGPVPTDTFKGEMYRSEKLSFVLGMLRDMGVKCKMDGKTVIVM